MNMGVTSVSGRRAWSNHLRLDSPYLAKPVHLTEGAPGARSITLIVEGWLGQEALRGTLIADPNEREPQGDAGEITRRRLAPRTYDVALVRLRADDPSRRGRRVYAITGVGLPEDMTLAIHPWGDRLSLDLPSAVVPLSERAVGHLR